MKKRESADKYRALLEKVQAIDLATGDQFWKPPEGRSTIRILPPVGDMEFFFVEMGRHYNQKVPCVNIISEGELECPVCDINEQLFQANEKEAASKFRVSRAFWMNIVDRSNEDAGPQIYTPGPQVFGFLVALVNDPDYGDISDVEMGIDIKLTRKGQGMETKYSVLPAMRASELGDEEDVDVWLEDAVDLAERAGGVLEGYTYEDMIEKAGLGAWFSDAGEVNVDGPVPWDDDYDDEPEKPRRTVSRRRRKRR